jgi:hypothetical protein
VHSRDHTPRVDCFGEAGPTADYTGVGAQTTGNSKVLIAEVAVNCRGEPREYDASAVLDRMGWRS